MLMTKNIKPNPLLPFNQNYLNLSMRPDYFQYPLLDNISYANKSNSRISFTEKYILTTIELGKGSNGSVILCKNKLTTNEFAVKIIKKIHSSTNKEVVEKFDNSHLSYDDDSDRQEKRIKREFKTYQLTKGHPNICQLIDFYETPLKYYMVFEKMSGGSLLNQIQRRNTFTEAEASLVTKDIANALEYLHRIGIAHRDLKPENVLCKHDNTLSPVKLADFDLASDIDLNGDFLCQIHTPELTTPVGSAEFMAPEVVKTYNGQLHSYDKRCDMWSLGVIIYILLCGYPPFYGQHTVRCPNYLNPNSGHHMDVVKYCDINVCPECRENLFDRIQNCRFDFPLNEWSNISPLAKSLISHLLIEKAAARFNASDVLKDPWITTPAPQTHLYTPNVLKRTNSSGSIGKFTQNAIAVNRMIQQCYAIHEDILESSKSIHLNEPSEPIQHLEPNEHSVESLGMNNCLLNGTSNDGNVVGCNPIGRSRRIFNTRQNTLCHDDGYDALEENEILNELSGECDSNASSSWPITDYDHDYQEGIDEPTPVGSCLENESNLIESYHLDKQTNLGVGAPNNCDPANKCKNTLSEKIVNIPRSTFSLVKRPNKSPNLSILGKSASLDCKTTLLGSHLNPSDIDKGLISRRPSVEELDDTTLKKRLERLQILQKDALAKSIGQASSQTFKDKLPTIHPDANYAINNGPVTALPLLQPLQVPYLIYMPSMMTYDWTSNYIHAQAPGNVPPLNYFLPPPYLNPLDISGYGNFNNQMSQNHNYSNQNSLHTIANNNKNTIYTVPPNNMNKVTAPGFPNNLGSFSTLNYPPMPNNFQENYNNTTNKNNYAVKPDSQLGYPDHDESKTYFDDQSYMNILL